MTYALGFIGAGNMAEAIVRGVLHGGHVSASQIIVSNRGVDRRTFFQERLGVRAVADNREVAAASETLVLCVKPQVCPDVLAAVADVVPADALIVSVMAGISAAYIERTLGGNRRVVRTMPNTPMLVGEGMVAIARGAHATAVDVETTRGLFSAAADVIEVDESQLGAVTAVSGSGPAYFFFLVEQMVAAGVKLGLSAEQAQQLATKTATGAARMLATSPDSPQELRRKVTSPGGTTQAAIEHMERGGFAAIITRAMEAASRRSEALGK